MNKIGSDNMLKKILILLLCLIFISGCQEENLTPEEELTPLDEVKEISVAPWILAYERELESFVATHGNATENIAYYIADIDKNGTPELIIRVGNDETSTIADVYTYDDSLKNIGNFSMNNSLLFASNNKYIIRQAIINNHEYIYNISIEDGEISENLEEDTDYTGQEEFTYKTFKNELNFYSISDYTPIENFE